MKGAGHEPKKVSHAYCLLVIVAGNLQFACTAVVVTGCND